MQLEWKYEEDHGYRWYATSEHRNQYGRDMSWCICPEEDGSFSVDLSPAPTITLPEQPKIYTLKEAKDYAQSFEDSFYSRLLPKSKYNMYLVYCRHSHTSSFYSELDEAMAKAQKIQGDWYIYVRLLSADPLDASPGISATTPCPIWDSEAHAKPECREKYKDFWPNGYPV